MRSYPNDSAQAAARIVSLAMLVDGGLDPSETACLSRSGLIKAMGLSEIEFDQVVREFCDDLLQSGDYWSSGRLTLRAEIIEHLLGEIRDPAQRVRLLAVILEIVAADGRVTSAEAALLSQAMRRWSDGLEH